jgi:hypothetical protein
VNYTQKIVSRRTRFHKHRHGGKRIPNFVMPYERRERRARPVRWFSSVQDLFADARRRGDHGV